MPPELANDSLATGIPASTLVKITVAYLIAVGVVMLVMIQVVSWWKRVRS